MIFHWSPKKVWTITLEFLLAIFNKHSNVMNDYLLFLQVLSIFIKYKFSSLISFRNIEKKNIQSCTNVETFK